jgi:hypothetical protein
MYDSTRGFFLPRILPVLFKDLLFFSNMRGPAKSVRATELQWIWLISPPKSTVFIHVHWNPLDDANSIEVQLEFT